MYRSHFPEWPEMESTIDIVEYIYCYCLKDTLLAFLLQSRILQKT